MEKFLLLICIFVPIIFSLLIRFLNISNKSKEKLNLSLVILTSLLVIITLLFNKEETLYIFRFTEKLTIKLKLDGIGSIFALMVSILWPFAYIYVLAYMSHHDKKMNYSMFYIITYGIVLGIAFSANLITMFMFYELLTLITLPLIIFDMTKEAKRATRFYLYISLFGSSLALFGIIILASKFNVVDFYGISQTILNKQDLTRNELNYIYFAYILMFFGFGVKAAVFPFHSWLPKAGVAPTPTTALLHAVAVVKAGAFAIIRTIYSTIGMDILNGSVVSIITTLFAGFTIIYGSSLALKHMHIKRRFAYSTVSNISYILLAATMCSKLGLYAALLHFIFHSFAKISIFFIAGKLLHNEKIVYVDQLDGLSKKLPFTFLMFILSGLSIIGIPMFAGFISKMQIGLSLLENPTWYNIIGLACLLISALLTAIYVMNIIFRVYFKKPNENNIAIYEKASEKDKKFMIPIATFSILSLLLGLFASPLLNLISNLVFGGAI